MNSVPLVSLIIISYNQKAYIDDCMKSLLQLTYSNIELLYLDDCSPDETFTGACLYEERAREKFGKVYFEKNKVNKGLIYNLNCLIQKSSGKYIKFLSADDFLLEDSITNMVDFMENHPESDMLYSNAVYGECDTHFPLNGSEQLPRLYVGEQLSGTGLFERLYESDFIAAPTVMTKKKVYDKLGLYDASLGIEDWDYFLRIARQGDIGYLDKVTVMYRFSNDSLSHSDNPIRRINMQKSELLIREKYKKFVQNSKRLIRKSFNNAYQDALHIDDKAYFDFLEAYAKRNQIGKSVGNHLRFLLYKLKIL